MSATNPFQPYNAYLEKIHSNVSNITSVQCQVIQGFFYGVCACILNDDVLHDVDNVLSWAGSDFIKYYRSDCVVLHGDMAHLAALIPSNVSEETVEMAAYEFETWFIVHMPPPHNTVFQMLAEGKEGLAISEPIRKHRRVHISAIRKTAKRRGRTGSPPPK